MRVVKVSKSFAHRQDSGFIFYLWGKVEDDRFDVVGEKVGGPGVNCSQELLKHGRCGERDQLVKQRFNPRRYTLNK